MKHPAITPVEQTDTCKKNFATTEDLDKLKDFLCEMINSLATQTSTVLARLKDDLNSIIAAQDNITPNDPSPSKSLQSQPISDMSLNDIAVLNQIETPWVEPKIPAKKVIT